MPSPFPGMDPYLEGQLWPDVHHALASQLRRQIVSHLPTRYVARIETQVVIDRLPRSETDVIYPDVSVLRRATPAPVLHETAVEYEARPARFTRAPSPTLWLPVATRQVRLASIEIRNANNDRLVTVIEILSPANKREPGLENYRRKRDHLIVDGVHLLEIDLIRRGVRIETDPLVAGIDYIISLIRAGAAMMEVWPVGLCESLPVVPVPLLDPDPDVPLDLPSALAAIYDEAAYDLSIDYTQEPPPPPLRAEDQEWLRALIAAKQEMAP